LDSSIADCEIFSYSSSISIVCKDWNRHGGGVAFLISPRIKFAVRSDLSNGNIEAVWIELFPNSRQAMLVCCVYRPPSQYTFFDNFLAECEAAQLQCPRLSVLADVNVNLLNPSSLSYFCLLQNNYNLLMLLGSQHELPSIVLNY